MNNPTYNTCDVCGSTLSHGGDCAVCLDDHFGYWVGLPEPSDYRGEDYGDDDLPF